ncbi:MAG: hypothetical protein OXG37_01095 [Actinomycetia bacterium]|nr:hypothetical protein [Actinomycetes bacterium]
MREKLRDKTRDQLTVALNALGVQAVMAERGRPEEAIHNSWWQRSLGVIDLPEGPVRWINVVKKDGGRDSPPRWWINLCIPDERQLPGRRTVKIKTARKKSFPLLGSVADVAWKGDDHRTGLIRALSDDGEVKGLAARVGNLRIRSHTGEFQGWTLQVDRRFIPTSEDWQTIQTIASRLLSALRAL